MDLLPLLFKDTILLMAVTVKEAIWNVVNAVTKGSGCHKKLDPGASAMLGSPLRSVPV